MIKTISLDLNRVAHYSKLAVNQGHTAASFNYGMRPLNGEDVRIDRKGTSHYLIQ
jgi:hypothetical protein